MGGGAPESQPERPAIKKVNESFFSIGNSRSGPDVIDEDAENRDDAWRNIKPTQNVDALSKEMYKKRKFEEFRARQASSKGRGHRSYKSQQAAKRPKITPEMEEKQRI